MTTDLTLSDAAISLSDRQIYIPDSFRIMGGGQGGIQVWATAPVSNSARYTRPAVMTSGNHRVLRTATPQGASPSRPQLTTKPLTTSIASQAGGGGTTDSYPAKSQVDVMEDAVVAAGFRRRDVQEVRQVFDAAKDPANHRIPPSRLPSALAAAGVRLAFRDVSLPSHDTSPDDDRLVSSLVCDDMKGVDEAGFLAAVKETDAVQRWLAGTPLADVVTDAVLSVMTTMAPGLLAGRDGGTDGAADSTVHDKDHAKAKDDVLRAVARLTPDHIAAAINRSLTGLQKVLTKGVEDLREGFDKLDHRAQDAVDSQTGVSKFATFTPSCGGISDFHQGLVNRVGECFAGLGECCGSRDVLECRGVVGAHRSHVMCDR